MIAVLNFNAYYARFRRVLARQKKRMKHSEDNYLYYFMFVARLEKSINAELFQLPEFLCLQDTEFHEVLELAKRAKQTVKS